jgi:hypothetical protein
MAPKIRSWITCSTRATPFGATIKFLGLIGLTPQLIWHKMPAATARVIASGEIILKQTQRYLLPEQGQGREILRQIKRMGREPGLPGKAIFLKCQ